MPLLGASGSRGGAFPLAYTKGIGIMEGAYAAVFGIMGLPIDGAVAFSLIQRAASLSIISVGIFYLSRCSEDWFGKRNLEKDPGETDVG
ncbi:hypothetical protein KAU37_02470 [Candidatus Bipolaricaulota bacterium]|nr:hypothetical protein [Candidatus Bipolaricaulota bacterium]